KSYVLTEDKVPCAYGLFRLLAGEGEILRIGTHPHHRRKGFARALLEHFFAQGKAEGLEKTFLEVREGNTPARALYESLGFCKVSVRRCYYRDPVEDAVIYEKK
ncbi:MAG: GNAT family N-acetyltransferase, partial [Clostridia bacterium]|nr:GNAT family N-acetyltransferase [Clostridia bacterium]